MGNRIQELLILGEDLKEAVNDLVEEIVTVECKKKLLKYVDSELTFLRRLCNSGQSVKTEHLSSSNLLHIQATCEALRSKIFTNVISVSQDVRVSGNETEHLPGAQLTARVDIVGLYNGKPIWLIISCSHARYLHYEEDNGLVEVGFKTPSLKQKVAQLLMVANQQSFRNKPDSLMFWFYCDLPDHIKGSISRDFGATELSLNEPVVKKGFWAQIQISNTEKPSMFCSGNISRELAQPIELSQKSLINLDTTALVALSSELSNGAATLISKMRDSELQSRYPAMWKFVKEQAESEVENPLIPQLERILAQKQLIVCESVLLEFTNIVETIAGKREKEKAKELLKRSHLVPDSPSKRVMDLISSNKVKQRHKIVFGTADSLNIPTLTANLAFVRAATQAGVPLAIIKHQPRAFLGM